jgi:hypothetical protein
MRKIGRPTHRIITQAEERPVGREELEALRGGRWHQHFDVLLDGRRLRYRWPRQSRGREVSLGSADVQLFVAFVRKREAATTPAAVSPHLSAVTASRNFQRLRKRLGKLAEVLFKSHEEPSAFQFDPPVDLRWGLLRPLVEPSRGHAGVRFEIERAVYDSVDQRLITANAEIENLADQALTTRDVVLFVDDRPFALEVPHPEAYEVEDPFLRSRVLRLAPFEYARLSLAFDVPRETLQAAIGQVCRVELQFSNGRTASKALPMPRLAD